MKTNPAPVQTHTETMADISCETHNLNLSQYKIVQCLLQHNAVSPNPRTPDNEFHFKIILFGSETVCQAHYCDLSHNKTAFQTPIKIIFQFKEINIKDL